MGLLDKGAGDHGAVLQHIIQIHQIAVVHMLGIVVGIVEVNDAGLMSRYNFRGQQNPAGDVLTDLTGHVVTLNRVDGGVLVGVLLLDFLVVALDQAEDPIVRGVGLPGQGTDVAVGNVFLGNLKGAMGHDGLLHQILNLLHGGAAAHFLAGNLHALGNTLDLQRGHPHGFISGFIGLGDSHDNFFNVKNNFRAVSFDNFHRVVLLGVPWDILSSQGLLYKILWFCQAPDTKYCVLHLSRKSYRFALGGKRPSRQAIVVIFLAFSKERFEIRRRL